MHNIFQRIFFGEEQPGEAEVPQSAEYEKALHEIGEKKALLQKELTPEQVKAVDSLLESVNHANGLINAQMYELGNRFAVEFILEAYRKGSMELPKNH